MTIDQLWTIKNVMNEVTGLATCHTGNAKELIDALRREGFLLLSAETMSLSDLDALQERMLAP